MRSSVFFSALLGASGLGLHADEPILTHVHPAGVDRGTTTRVTLAGRFHPWPCNVWADTGDIVFSPATENGTYDVAVASNTSAGPHLIRAFNTDGASAPISMVVSAAPEVIDAEPNDDFRAPQVLATPTTVVNGRLDKAEDVDSFLVTLRKGQTLVARVEAQVLAAGVDAMLQIKDERGMTLAFNHDHVTMDPFLAFEVPADGKYIVQTMGHKYPATAEVKFAGGKDCVYRLHLSTEPVVRNAWPLAIERGKPAHIAIEGWNLATTSIDLDGCVPAGAPVAFSEFPELAETAEPQSLDIPCGLSGRIDPPGDEDRFSFSAAKGAVCEIVATGARHGSRIDPWIKLQDKDGKELASNDDHGGSTEARLVWTAPDDGSFTAVVGDLTQRGGPEFYYHLTIAPPTPAATASISSHSLKLEAGKSADLKTTVTLTHGYQGKLRLAAKCLPDGIEAPEVDVPEKGGNVTLKITAPTTAPAASQPFQVVLREVESSKEFPVRYSMASTSEDNGVPQGFRQLLINSTDQLWLTIIAPPPPAPVLSESKPAQ